MDQHELALCMLLNRVGKRHLIEQFFRGISRLGDGVFWYIMMLALPLVIGPEALIASLHMIIVGVLALVIYKMLKPRFVRNRPFMRHEGIQLGIAPLDQYSFPSGHTLHAVAFTIVATAYYPGLAWIAVPFAVLVALSRVVLGLHYPSDVLAGVVLGTGLAVGSFQVL